jgi:exodeoxyribonuclease VII small subunit
VTQSQAKVPFETAFAQLEDVVQRLEEGDLPLAEAMALYERGMALAEHCQTVLDEAELRVSQVAGGGDEAPFEDEEG